MPPPSPGGNCGSFEGFFEVFGAKGGAPRPGCGPRWRGRSRSAYPTSAAATLRWRRAPYTSARATRRPGPPGKFAAAGAAWSSSSCPQRLRLRLGHLQGFNIQEKWMCVSWLSTYLKFARVSSSPLVPSLFTMMKAAIFALSLAVASAANLRAAAEPKPEVRPRRPPSTPRGGG